MNHKIDVKIKKALRKAQKYIWYNKKVMGYFLLYVGDLPSTIRKKMERLEDKMHDIENDFYNLLGGYNSTSKKNNK